MDQFTVCEICGCAAEDCECASCKECWECGVPLNEDALCERCGLAYEKAQQEHDEKMTHNPTYAFFYRMEQRAKFVEEHGINED